MAGDAPEYRERDDEESHEKYRKFANGTLPINQRNASLETRKKWIRTKQVNEVRYE